MSTKKKHTTAKKKHTTATWHTLAGTQVDTGKAAGLAKMSHEEGDGIFDVGVGPSGRPFGANFVNTPGAGELDPTLYWFPTAEELVAFLAGAACASLGEQGDDHQGTPAERAESLCRAIGSATKTEDILAACAWYSQSELTWVGTLDDLFHGKDGIPLEARASFEEYVEDSGNVMPKNVQARKALFIDWLDERCEDGCDSGFC